MRSEVKDEQKNFWSNLKIWGHLNRISLYDDAPKANVFDRIKFFFSSVVIHSTDE